MKFLLIQFYALSLFISNSKYSCQHYEYENSSSHGPEIEIISIKKRSTSPRVGLVIMQISFKKGIPTEQFREAKGCDILTRVIRTGIGPHPV